MVCMAIEKLARAVDRCSTTRHSAANIPSVSPRQLENRFRPATISPCVRDTQTSAHGPMLKQLSWLPQCGHPPKKLSGCCRIIIVVVSPRLTPARLSAGKRAVENHYNCSAARGGCEIDFRRPHPGKLG